jgi:hypothetical protein
MKYHNIIEPYLNNTMSMDIRHANIIEYFIKSINKFSNFIEVGSCYGVSTSCIVRACEESGNKCVLIDLHFTDPVLKIREQASGLLNLTLYQESSLSAIDKEINSESIILLDGDHTLNAVQAETKILKNYMPKCILLHDVSNSSQYCEGPKWAFDEWTSLGYYGIIDCTDRSGERTHRGLGILCRDAEDYQKAQFVMKLFT